MRKLSSLGSEICNRYLLYNLLTEFPAVIDSLMQVNVRLVYYSLGTASSNRLDPWCLG